MEGMEFGVEKSEGDGHWYCLVQIIEGKRRILSRI